jgi:hypothetical protein
MMRPVADPFRKDRAEHVVLADGAVEPLHELRDESIIDFLRRQASAASCAPAPASLVFDVIVCLDSIKMYSYAWFTRVGG